MTLFSTDQALGWRLTEAPVYEDDVVLGIRSSRKENMFEFFESNRMALAPFMLGLNERKPSLMAALDYNVRLPASASGAYPPIPAAIAGATVVRYLWQSDLIDVIGSVALTSNGVENYVRDDVFCEVLGITKSLDMEGFL